MGRIKLLQNVTYSPMTNEYQPLQSSKPRNYLLVTLAATLAIVGAVCFYQSMATRDQVSTSVVDLAQYDCADARVPNCGQNSVPYGYFPAGRSCKIYTCCPRLKRPDCGSNTRRLVTDAAHCQTYVCCPPAPKCPTGSRRKTHTGFPCNRYTCEKSEQGIATTCGKDQKSTRVYQDRKYVNVCCPKKPSRSSCNGRITSSYGKPCRQYTCCPNRPRCARGEYMQTTRGTPCWTYKCVPRTA